MPTPEPSTPVDESVTNQELTARAGRTREEAAALLAQSRQAHRQAGALVEASNAILESVVAITEEILARRRFALAAPVAARFQTDACGSTGIELSVTLKDPATAVAAKQAITERFGGEGTSDRLKIR